MHNTTEIKPSDARDHYLTAIYQLSNKLSSVRSVDIAAYRRISKAAVSMKIKELKKQGLIRVDSNRVTLTRKGLDIAERITRNYSLFKLFLVDSGIDEVNAEEIACLSASTLTSRSADRLENRIDDKLPPALPGHFHSLGVNR